MRRRSAIGAVVLMAALATAIAGAQAQEEGKYPDLKGQWINAAGQEGQWDPTKPPGKAQQPPLTAEYQAIWDATLAKRALGWKDASCLPPGMPRSMMATDPVEFIVIPNTTYVVLSVINEFRRIYTYGRKWLERKGRAIHTQSDFLRPLYEWGDALFANAVGIGPGAPSG